MTGSPVAVRAGPLSTGQVTAASTTNIQNTRKLGHSSLTLRFAAFEGVRLELLLTYTVSGFKRIPNGNGIENKRDLESESNIQVLGSDSPLSDTNSLSENVYLIFLS